MPGRSSRPGPALPYRLLAGVVPTATGWLVASAKLQGVTVAPQDPEVFPNLVDVLDYRPGFDVIALGAPVGLLDHYEPGGRACDREARRILGRWPGTAITPPPSREALDAGDFSAAMETGCGSALSWAVLPHIREIVREVQPYLQRTVYEVDPELSFYQLNGDVALSHPKHTEAGRVERRAMLEARINRVERIIAATVGDAQEWQLLDAAVCLWTARRIVARAVQRVPDQPEWDSEGLRMEIMR